MLDDRDYMRQPEYDEPRWSSRWGVRWSLTLVFLAAYVAVFLADLALGKFAPVEQGRLFTDLALSNAGLSHGYVWQLVTYQFLHAGWTHLFFNCWTIYMFGQELEFLLGRKRFAAIMLSSGIIGGVFQSATSFLWHNLFGGAVVGASACGFGLVTAFTMIFPEEEMAIFFIPVRIKAKTLLIFFAVLAVLGIIFQETVMPGVAHAAHLGGMAMGWFYVKYILKNPALIGTEEPAESRRAQAVVKPKSEEKTTDEFLESEVDPILDKISARGIQSLTARERAILESARKKMSRP